MSEVDERWKALEALAAEKELMVSKHQGVMTGWWVYIDRSVENDTEHKGVLNRYSIRAETLDTAINQAEDWIRYNT